MMMSCFKACACCSLFPFSRTLWLPDVEAMLQNWIIPKGCDPATVWLKPAQLCTNASSLLSSWL